MIIALIFLVNVGNAIKLPGSCSVGEYYEPSLMQCLSCALNDSLTTSSDGFGCSCVEHSVPVGIARCRPCNVTELVSADGGSCVPRRCQTSAGRVACRKCPRDYITVTQNFDGTLMKEVQCIKCARGFKVQDNSCVRCESCVCTKHDVVVAGKCVPKKYLLDRPKYMENRLHPTALLEILKFEYLCTEQDLRACRALGSLCVRNFYSVDMAGPCRLWLKPNVTVKGLPLLDFPVSKNGDEVILEPGLDGIKIVIVEYTSSGGMKILENPSEGYFKCIPSRILIGKEIMCNVVNNVSDISSSDYNNTYEINVGHKNDLKPLSIKVVRNGRRVQRGLWASDKFHKIFVLEKSVPITTNLSELVYLRSLIFQISISRDTKSGSLKTQLSVEAQYENKSPLTETITTTVEVHHQLPQAGVVQSLEILGGIFGTAMALFSLVKWRGAVRRGSTQYVVVPITASAIADALYVAILLSTLHALAAEAGTLGLTLPLSKSEETLITSLLYAVVSLKAIKIAWMNYSQCRNSIMFIDWSKHCPSCNEVEISDTYDWRKVLIAKDWTAMQTKRRVSPGFTAALSLLVIHVLDARISRIPNSQGYKWVVVAISWWSSYTILLLARYAMDMVNGSPVVNLPSACCGVGISLLIFQEEKYAHYVNGRNEETPDFKIISGPPATCRLFFSPQLREIYTKISNDGYGAFGQDSNHELLARFMAAFFERALNGLNWITSERTVLERLLDVELVDREGGNTSIILYDADKTPSCFAVTWWGEEWLLATFDAMLFDNVYMATGQPFLAALITLVTWQIMKLVRKYFGSRNLPKDYSATKTSVPLKF